MNTSAYTHHYASAKAQYPNPNVHPNSMVLLVHAHLLCPPTSLISCKQQHKIHLHTTKCLQKEAYVSKHKLSKDKRQSHNSSIRHLVVQVDRSTEIVLKLNLSIDQSNFLLSYHASYEDLLPVQHTAYSCAECQVASMLNAVFGIM